jgi:hypothetical protein
MHRSLHDFAILRVPQGSNELIQEAKNKTFFLGGLQKNIFLAVEISLDFFPQLLLPSSLWFLSHQINQVW